MSTLKQKLEYWDNEYRPSFLSREFSRLVIEGQTDMFSYYDPWNEFIYLQDDIKALEAELKELGLFPNFHYRYTIRTRNSGGFRLGAKLTDSGVRRVNKLREKEGLNDVN